MLGLNVELMVLARSSLSKDASVHGSALQL